MLSAIRLVRDLLKDLLVLRKARRETSELKARFGPLDVRLDAEPDAVVVWLSPPEWLEPRSAHHAPEDLSVTLTEEDWFLVTQAIWQLPDRRPCMNLEPEDARLFVYLTDSEYRRRRRIKKADTPRAYLATSERKGEGEPDKCLQCRRYIAAGGIRCNVCGRGVEELRREVRTLAHATITSLE